MQVLEQPTYNLQGGQFRMAPLLPKGYPENPSAVFNFRAQTSMPQEDSQRKIVRKNDMGEPVDIIHKGYRRFLINLTFSFLRDEQLSEIMQFFYDINKGAEGRKDFVWVHPTEINPSTGQPQKYIAKFNISSRGITSTIFTHERRDVRNLELLVIGWMD